MNQPESSTQTERTLSAAEVGAIAHLYRGEVYRSTVWRSRLDNTTNWSVVTTGLALSLSYSDAQASVLPLVLMGLLISVFTRTQIAAIGAPGGAPPGGGKPGWGPGPGPALKLGESIATVLPSP